MRQVLKPSFDLVWQFFEGELAEVGLVRMKPTSDFDMQLLGSVVDHEVLGVVFCLAHGNWEAMAIID